MKKSIYIVILLLISNVSFSQYIIPITNGDSCGFSGDGGPAINACVHRTIGICRDAAGNLYFTDYDYGAYGRVRKITAATGKIETIAGGGTATGNNIPATSAALPRATGVCIDNAGNLLVADAYARIWKVNLSTGIMSTVAGMATQGYTGNGGPATAAQLAGPVDVAVDSADNIYIVDEINYVIRKVTAATGIITTVAGTGTRGYNGDNIPATAAQLGITPEGIYVDKKANLYIADENNNRIRKVNAATGIITTIAGTGMEGTSGDGGPATAAVLNNPERVTMDKAGNIYFSSGDDRIRRVDATTGIITTYAGNGFGGETFAVSGSPATTTPIEPFGLCFDTCGNLFFANVLCHVLAVVPELPVGGVACHFLVNSVPAVVLPTGHWQVYPNPASGSLTVNAPNGSYDITDMLGRTLLQGALTAGEQTIDITSLTPGSYIFTGYTGDTRNYHSIFVKQ